MKVLVTGNLGYIGSVLTEELINRGHEVVGLDIGYYTDCVLYPAAPVSRQITKDIREVSADDFAGIDAVIHLAALSNDPLGELDPDLTTDINLRGTQCVAKMARAAGVTRFVYASSQSMYGVSDTSHELSEDEAGPYGVTAYARTKWAAELALKEMSSPSFVVVCFRPSTVFGASPRLRCDIVFNNLVACAYTTDRIEIKSDGTPWRPVVHIQDVSSAFISGIEAPANLVMGQSFNVGIPNGNFTVRDLAEAAQRAVPASQLIFTGEHGSDARTYRVSFNKILTVLKDYYQPRWNLDKGGQALVAMFTRVGLNEAMFRGRQTNRLQQINHLVQSGQLNNALQWHIAETSLKQ